MRKLHKILLAVFCSGVLLCGLGAGLAFIEFSELHYGGMQYVGKTQMCTEDMDVEFEPGEEKTDITGRYWWRTNDVIYDKEVPVNTVRLRVTYNAARIEPYAHLDNENDIVFYYHIINEDEMALIMEAKDVILQNLRAGSIVSVDTAGLEKVVVLINPENAEDVMVRN